ncbi:hypothetical protein Q5752_001856 [Cryptotrichosporon argae]
MVAFSALASPLALVPSIKQALLLALAYVVVRALHYFVYRPLTSPLRRVQRSYGGTGPLGHSLEISSYYMQQEWDRRVETYGKTFRLNGPLYCNERVYTIDARAVAHVLANHYDYVKPEMLRKAIQRYMREGLIGAEGDRHRVQRKVVARVFSANGLRDMGATVAAKAEQLRELLAGLCADSTATHPIGAAPLPEGGSADQHEHARVVDMFGAGMRITYDIVGEIALGHEFNALGDPHGEGGHMFEAYEHGQTLCQGSVGFRGLLTIMYPWIDKVWPSENARRVAAAMDPLDRLAKQLVKDRKQAFAEGKDVEQRDVLTLMVRANMADDVAPDRRLREGEVWGQLATFMFAGSDTTANALAYTMLCLAENAEIQDRLRKECLEYGDALTYDNMDELVYLDAVIKETLRVNPSIPGTIREAVKDDVIPLAEPITLVDGTTTSSIQIRKGQFVHMPIEMLNMAPSIWGPTAYTFDPSRWLDAGAGSTASSLRLGPDGVPLSPVDKKAVPHGAVANGFNDGPGVWPNVMTFIDGPRRCVAYKLAIMELKLIVFMLVRHFVWREFPGARIYKWNMFSTRPYVAGSLIDGGSQLPLIVTPYKPEQ